MTYGRSFHAASTLPGGEVLITGGTSGDPKIVSSVAYRKDAEIY